MQVKENDPSAGSFNRSSVVRLMQSMSLTVILLHDKDEKLFLGSRFSKAEKQSAVLFIFLHYI